MTEERRKGTLSDEDFDAIVKRTKEVVRQELRDEGVITWTELYEIVGKGVVTKAIWICGAGILALACWLAGAGKIKIGG